MCKKAAFVASFAPKRVTLYRIERGMSGEEENRYTYFSWPIMSSFDKRLSSGAVVFVFTVQTLAGNQDPTSKRCRLTQNAHDILFLCNPCSSIPRPRFSVLSASRR